MKEGFNRKAYKSYYTNFDSKTQKLLDIIRERENQEINMKSYLSQITLDILGLSVFGYDFGGLEGKFDEVYGHYSKFIYLNHNPLPRMFPWLEYTPYAPIKAQRSSLAKLFKFFNEVIKKTIEDPSNNTLLSHMIMSVDVGENSDEQQKLSQDELYANMFVLFLAGHETTTDALGWALLRLAHHPDIQENIYEEISEKVGVNQLTFEILGELKQLKLFINEVLRLHSPASLLPFRRTTRDLNYKGVTIPKGHIVTLNQHAIHRNPKYWDDPDRFDPSRFEKKDVIKHRAAYQPFSVGIRECIGKQFSLMEQRLVLAELIRRYKISAPDSGQQLCKYDPRTIVTFAPKTVNVIFSPRT
eukprot:TRINITY_DN9724_c0_g1_i1.p1 TRINITY_DN9724_c0_g1~~TRINITY_DN9724_c0_g1_i1.p1  ORF type:complete len:357 (+),score=57.59 TRINITY_DN9724_c0_g1_i1:507-1577(+)